MSQKAFFWHPKKGKWYASLWFIVYKINKWDFCLREGPISQQTGGLLYQSPEKPGVREIISILENSTRHWRKGKDNAFKSPGSESQKPWLQPSPICRGREAQLPLCWCPLEVCPVTVPWTDCTCYQHHFGLRNLLFTSFLMSLPLYASLHTVSLSRFLMPQYHS